MVNTTDGGGALALTLTQANGGTRISSTRYVHYGTVTARRACPPACLTARALDPELFCFCFCFCFCLSFSHPV